MSEKQNIKRIEKGFSLVELMVVIAIIAILAAVAIPMYGNYSIRAKIGSEIEKLGSAKEAAAEYIIHNNDSLDYTVADLGTLPSGASVGDNGTLLLDTSNIVADSSVSLVPTIGSGSIIWSCSATGLTSSQLPNECQESSSEGGNNSSDSGGFDVSQIQSSNIFAGDSCSTGSSCYSYGSDVTISDSSDGFFYIEYPGAGEGVLYSDIGLGVDDVAGVGINQSSVIHDNVEYFSRDDVENSDLSTEQKQLIYNAVDAAKSLSGGICDNVNTTSWACQ